MVLAAGPDERTLADLFAAILAYDDVFARHCANPVDVPTGTVTVSGSGKETFKTFNVSTAAALLAAAAGVPVVKGVSRSVSATTGALDILDHLGIEVTASPSSVTPPTRPLRHRLRRLPCVLPSVLQPLWRHLRRDAAETGPPPPMWLATSGAPPSLRLAAKHRYGPLLAGNGPKLVACVTEFVNSGDGCTTTDLGSRSSARSTWPTRWSRPGTKSSVTSPGTSTR